MDIDRYFFHEVGCFVSFKTKGHGYITGWNVAAFTEIDDIDPGARADG